jgi:signal transduction histidine kinase
MAETVFEELKRYMQFDPGDEAALRSFATEAVSHAHAVADVFYERLQDHEHAKRVISGPEQLQRLKGTLREWLALLVHGPWNEAYYEKRARIGRVHVKIGLPQLFMFGAMDVIRLQLSDLAQRSQDPKLPKDSVVVALHKILDIELAIMLETYRDALLDVRVRRAERLAALGTMAAGLAHELRNPLNSATLQLNVARRKLARPEAPDFASARKAIDLAESEMTRLAGLVQDFLQFARPQPLRLLRADLRSTAEVIVALVAPEAEQAGVTLVLESGGPVVLEVDDEKMKQVLLNLVRNAVEASPRGGLVTVRVDASGGQACLSVQDDGPGVPSDSPIFEPFFTTKEDGTGLGLAIVHRIVLDHGGTVSVETAPGRTVFSVLLPIQPP